MKVGDYVRTNYGGIGTITKCPFSTIYTDEIWGDIENTKTIITDYVYKTSPNIIDLISIGDILIIKTFDDVACMIFTDIYLIQNENQLSNIKEDLEKNKNMKLYSIVTKEQFESIEYKIGG